MTWQTSSTVLRMSKNSELTSNLLFSIRLMSRASSITCYRCIAEFSMMFRYLWARSSVTRPSKILHMGRIEFSGVRSSCATEEKSRDRVLAEVRSSSLIFVMSFRKTMTSSLSKDAFTCTYLLLGSFLLKMCALWLVWMKSRFSRKLHRLDCKCYALSSFSSYLLESLNSCSFYGSNSSFSVSIMVFASLFKNVTLEKFPFSNTITADGINMSVR